MTVILTWNPKQFAFLEDVFDRQAKLINRRGWTSDWSVGKRVQGIEPGDVAYLLRQGAAGRGLVLRGVIESQPWEDLHWEPAKADQGITSMFVDVTWYDALAREDWIDVETLQREVPGIPWSKIYSSGFTKISHSDETHLDALWTDAMGGRTSPKASGLDFDNDEIPVHVEGNKVTVQVSRYERDPKARAACIAAHGAVCAACGFDFGEVYGERGEGYIVVHHKKPLASLQKASVVDPVKDLVPLCANCHAMVHRTAKPLSIPALKKLLAAQR